MGDGDMVLSRIRQFIRENRRLAPFRWAGAAAEKYLHAYYNEAFYDFRRNGELFALRTFSSWWGDSAAVVWDVGANCGQWVTEAAAILPSANFHAFEILPSVREQLKIQTMSLKNVQAHDVGLSDAAGEIIVHLNRDDDSTSSVAPRLGSPYFQRETIPVPCEVITADEMAQRIPAPDLVKLDVEGHETAVLRGAQHLLASPTAPAMLQIEYGETYIPSGSTLRALYDLVEPHGYAIGRLYPNHVDFRPYAYEQDNYRMGNLIAAKPTDLRRLLAR